MFLYWHSHGLSGDTNFNIGHASKKLDSEVLARARIAYDAMQRCMTFIFLPFVALLYSVSGSQPKGKGKDKGFGKGKGYGKAKGSSKGKFRHHATHDPYL